MLLLGLVIVIPIIQIVPATITRPTISTVLEAGETGNGASSVVGLVSSQPISLRMNECVVNSLPSLHRKRIVL